jgi:outer membrane protein assembly factor BamB
MPQTAAALICVLACSAGADDWPQWRGPARDGVCRETGLARSWPAGGPPLLWKFDGAGVGYSGPAIVGDRLYALGADDAAEFLFALDVKSGRRLWSTRIGPRTENPWGDGPRSTPTVDGDTVYALGGAGVLAAVAAADGRLLRTRDLRKDLEGELQTGFGIDWGYCESPLVDGDRIIVCPGGAKGAMVALDKHTGNVVWRCTAAVGVQTYSSTMPITVGGVRQYVQVLGNGVVGVAAADGRLLWHHKIAFGLGVHVPTPVVHGDSVYVTTGYVIGCTRLKLSADGKAVRAEPAYSNKEMTNHHGGVVLLDGHVYGYSDNRGWVCQEFAAGRTVWAEKDKLGKGSIAAADGRLYVLTERGGHVGLLAASPAGYVEHGRFTLPKLSGQRKPRGGVWTHPVIAGGRLYLRDQELLYCFDVRGRE